MKRKYEKPKLTKRSEVWLLYRHYFGFDISGLGPGHHVYVLGYGHA